MVWPPDNDQDCQERDGLNMFEPLGFMNIINRLAGGDPLKWDAVSELSNNYVLTFYRLEVAKAWYNYNVGKKHEPKK